MNNLGLTNSQIADLITWRKMQDRVKSFQNKGSPMIFEEIFGSTEGLRLFHHFKMDCDSSYDRLNTYLNVDQHNLLLVHLLNSMYYEG